jgi:hypothetical protein
MDDPFFLLATLVGVDLETLIAYLAVVVTVSNIIGRLIPDTAVGPLGVLRKVCKVIGIYVGNRVAPTLTANDAARAVIGFRGLQDTKVAAESVVEAAKIGAAAGQKVTDVLDELGGRQDGLPYVPGVSPEPGSPVPDQYRTDGPFAAGARAAAAREGGE